MKRLFLLLTFISISMFVFSQNLKPVEAIDGLRVGRTYKKLIPANNLKTLVGIDTTKTIAEQFGAKPDSSQVLYFDDAVNPITTGEIYSAAAVDTLLNDNNKTLRQLSLLGNTWKVIPVFSTAQLGGVAATETLTDNKKLGITYIIEKPTLVTGYVFNVATGANVTYDQENGLCLFSVNITTHLCSQIAATKEVNSTFWNTGGTHTVPFSGGAITLQPGVYHLVILSNWSASTTAPALYRCGNLPYFTSVFSTSVKVLSSATGINSMPTSYYSHDDTEANNVIAIGLY